MLNRRIAKSLYDVDIKYPKMRINDFYVKCFTHIPTKAKNETRPLSVQYL